MPIRVLTTLACLLVPALGAAETAEEIVAKHLAARGGLERIKAVQTMKITRTVSTFSANLQVVLLKKRPHSIRSEVTFPGRPATLRVLGPAGLWEVGPDGKVEERPAEMATELAELDADIDGLLVDYAQKGHSVQYNGREKVGGVDVHKLTVTLKSGAARQVYLDAATYLERKHVGTITLPQQGKVQTTLTFSDYRDVGGLKLPFAVDEERSSFPVQSLSVYMDRIELDMPIDDSLFAKPTPSTR